jgi:hypothetical protein
MPAFFSFEHFKKEEENEWQWNLKGKKKLGGDKHPPPKYKTGPILDM